MQSINRELPLCLEMAKLLQGLYDEKPCNYLTIDFSPNFPKHSYLKGQKKGRMTRLKGLAEERRTMVFYESPHRLVKALTQFAEYFGSERQASVSREISKIHEETVRGTLTELIEHFTANEPRGEIVIVVAGIDD